MRQPLAGSHQGRREVVALLYDIAGDAHDRLQAVGVRGARIGGANLERLEFDALTVADHRAALDLIAEYAGGQDAHGDAAGDQPCDHGQAVAGAERRAAGLFRRAPLGHDLI